MTDPRPGRAPDIEDPVVNPVELAQAILRRDRRKMWLLAGLAAALWLLAAAAVLAMVWFHYLLTHISQMVRSFRHGVCAFSSENPAIPTTSC
jgi:hypothetical protein